MPKVFIVSGSVEYSNLFTRKGWAIVYDIAHADLVCFTGGEDVSPSLYNEQRHIRTYSNTLRDDLEKEIFEEMKEKKIPMVGICRGGQFLNVVSGGAMYQHVTNHCGDHNLTDLLTGESITVSSTHHQMMRPGPDALLVAIAQMNGTKEYMDGDCAILVNAGTEPDVEVLYYPSTRCLCFQPHPEFFNSYQLHYQAMRDYFFSLISKHFGLQGGL